MRRGLRIFSVRPNRYNDPAYWSLLDWCRRRGANEFTFDIWCYEIGACDELQAAIEDRLITYRLEPAIRAVPFVVGWHKEALETPLWMLTEPSLAEFRRILEEQLGVEETNDERSGETIRAGVSTMVVYRQKEPMLGRFVHQGGTLLYVYDAEVEELRALCAYIRRKTSSIHIPPSRRRKAVTDHGP